MWRRVSLLLLAASIARADEPAATITPTDELAATFAELARLGIMDPKTGTSEFLEAELRTGEAALERSDFGAAAASFYAILASPRFADFANGLPFQNAEYDLVVALAGGGAYDEAVAAALRVLARGPKARYYAVAHRRAIDVALESRRYGAVLAQLAPFATTESEALAERHYLAGRAAYEASALDVAERELTAVSRRSRLYSSAVYLRGVLRVRQGRLKEAIAAFCEIAGTADQDHYTFYVDDRYFGLKDLARLASGRLAHEEKRYDDAYYHYFQIPDDSDRLPEALFEAAWSMYQKRELRTGRELVAELIKSFPTSPLLPEAMLLAGYIELADCKFEAARQRFDALAADLRPLVAVIEQSRGARPLRQALFGRALARAQRRGPAAAVPAGTGPEERVLTLLRVEPRVIKLDETLAGLRREAEVAAHAVAEWRELAYRVGAHTGQVAAIDVDGTARLRGEIRQLREEVRRERAELLAGAARAPDDAVDRLPILDRADAQLAALASKTAAARGGASALEAKIEAELARTIELAAQSRARAESWSQELDAIGARELLRVHAQLVRIFERARLGKVDAVIGEKRLLEREIEDLAADRYVPRTIGRAYAEGIDETEEYWPPEDEVWRDEYDRWK